MKQDFFSTAMTLLVGFGLALLLCSVLLSLRIRFKAGLRLAGRPGTDNGPHPISPVVGGLSIGLSILCVALIYSPLRELCWQYAPLIMVLAILLVVGVIDDRLPIPAVVRFQIQLLCAVAVAWYGIRLTSLHGLLGIRELPLLVQYGLTILILTGMANAFKLIDSVDGLAGNMAITSCVLLSALALWLGHVQWLALLMPLTGSLLAFLTFNWRPARLSMGNGGSVVLGFLLAMVGIILVELACQQSVSSSPQVVALITASYMIPIADALRVLLGRIRNGSAGFWDTKVPANHWLSGRLLAFSPLTLRIVGVYLLLVVLSLIGSFFLSISALAVLQATCLIAYAKLAQLSHSFQYSYRLVKKLETR